MKIRLHINFLFGTWNDEYFIDYRMLTDPDDEDIDLFFKDVEKNGFLCGRNKKSNETKHPLQRQITNDYNLWHYHLITKEQKIDEEHSHIDFCKGLIEENDGIVNPRLIHYINGNEEYPNEKIIVGFSPKHDENDFPQLYARPINERVQTCNEKNLLGFPEIKIYLDYINNMFLNDKQHLISKESFLEYKKSLN